MPAPPAIPDYETIAKAILDQLGAQIGLATTLATAVSGGLVALVIQLAIHNGSANTKIVLSARWCIIIALILEGVSLGLGYLARAAVTDVAPILMRLPASAWESASGAQIIVHKFSDVPFGGSWQLGFYTGAQFATLFLGIVFISILAACNLHKLLPR